MGNGPDAESLSVLVVDDDPVMIQIARTAVAAAGATTMREASSASEAFGLLSSARFDLVFLDLGLGDRSGPGLISDVATAGKGALIAVITADERSVTIVECMKRGAFDFLPKPISPARLMTVLSHVREIETLRREVRLLKGEEGGRPRSPAFDKIITRSSLMLDLFRAAERIATSPLAVLITGESGVGKELVAEAVHELSGLSGAFVPVNVAGLDDALFADTLFGHMRGAYTGADGVRRGLVRQAEGGTLFLDEIGDIGMDAQVKLLRFLQSGEFYPLGADRSEKSSARIVMATNADLQSKVKAGSFRADLYFRLMIHSLSIPPLRDRREDLPLLVERFAGDAALLLGRPVPRNAATFAAAMETWPFPGNVRELFALVHSAMGSVEGRDLPVDFARRYMEKYKAERLAAEASCPDVPNEYATAEGRFLTLDEVMERHISEALRLSAGNQSEAARLLGISQSTISRRLRT